MYDHYVIGQNQGTIDRDQTTNTYNSLNSNYSVSFDYPSSWSVNETDVTPDDRIDLIAEFVSPLEALDDTYTEYVQINRDNGVFFNDLKTYLQESINSYRDSVDNFKLIHSSPFASLSGYPAYSLTYTQVLGGEVGQDPITLKNFEIGLLLNNTAYYIIYIGQEDQFDRYYPIIGEMINSFKLNPPTNTTLTTPALSPQPQQLIDQIAKELSDANPSINIDAIKKVLKDSTLQTESKGQDVRKVLNNILQQVTTDSNGPVASKILEKTSSMNTNIVTVPSS
jgi:hypothetical protein